MLNITKQIYLTLLLLAITLLVFEFSDIDLLVQDWMFDFQHDTWILSKSNKIAKLVLYDGIKVVYASAVLALFIAVTVFRKKTRIRSYYPGLLIVLFSCVLVPLTIAGLKAETNTPCPKHITHYQGNLPYVTVFDTYPEGTRPEESIRCYPAAHASGGFALLSLFFLFKSRRNRRRAIAFALIVGWSTGVYKMAIGDHFLSHTIVSMLLAWLIVLLVQCAVTRKWTSFDEESLQER